MHLEAQTHRHPTNIYTMKISLILQQSIGKENIPPPFFSCHIEHTAPPNTQLWQERTYVEVNSRMVLIGRKKQRKENNVDGRKT